MEAVILKKYPRTPHLAGSRLQPGDEDLMASCCKAGANTLPAAGSGKANQAVHPVSRIVYLETDWNEQLRRNASRPNAVPEQAICHMMEELVLPEVKEPHRVEWYTI